MLIMVVYSFWWLATRLLIVDSCIPNFQLKRV